MFYTNNKTMMKQQIILVVLILTLSSCHRIYICGMGAPRTNINIINDSIFTYHHYAGTINNKNNFSKGTILKVKRNKYLLQSFDFSPKKIPYSIEQKSIKEQKGLNIYIKTDIYTEFFEHERVQTRLFVNNKCYYFSSQIIDTLINFDNVDSIRIEIELGKKNIELPHPIFWILRTENIIILNGVNKIEIAIPITGEEFNWVNIDKKYLIKKGKSYELDDKVVQVEKISTYNTF